MGQSKNVSGQDLAGQDLAGQDWDERRIDPADMVDASDQGILGTMIHKLAGVFVLCIMALVLISEMSSSGQSSGNGQNDDVTRNATRASDQARNARTESHGAAELSLEADSRGHFFVEAEVDGARISFLVDTGASAVILSPGDAARIGLSEAELDFSQQISTANGIVRAAPVEFGLVSIGALQVENVPGAVIDADLDISLLGMSFLNRLDGYRVEDDRLVLSW